MRSRYGRDIAALYEVTSIETPTLLRKKSKIKGETNV
jgi:hypothetical protein